MLVNNIRGAVLNIYGMLIVLCAAHNISFSVLRSVCHC